MLPTPSRPPSTIPLLSPLSSHVQVRGDLQRYTSWAGAIEFAMAFMSNAKRCPTMCAAHVARAHAARIQFTV